jgi:hypothetical protein
LKIQEILIDKIFSGEKTMEIRSVCYDVLGQRIALGNSGNWLVEGNATDMLGVVFLSYKKEIDCRLAI